MKILVTGVKGQLGYDICKVLSTRNIEHVGADVADFDITDAAATAEFIKKIAPDMVIHCAAYTAVDRAEDEADICERVNVLGSRNIAIACKEIGAAMVYISTDYVFPGTGEAAYEVDDATGPKSVYGETKLAGELAVKEALDQYYIIRISWVFGYNGNNFIKTMLRLAETKDVLNVVADQIGSPTYTADAAVAICDIAQSRKYGTYHVTNEGYCSWAEFSEEIFKQAQKNIKVNHIPTSEYPTKAARPMNSRMSKAALDEIGVSRLPQWQDAVRRYLLELTQAEQ